MLGKIIEIKDNTVTISLEVDTEQMQSLSNLLVVMQDKKIAPFFDEFDFIISGHMHSGVVPPVLNDFWRSDRGILAPGKLLFPKNARSVITSPDQKNIICGAVSTIQGSAKPVTFINGDFPINIATLEFSHRDTYAHKPDVKHEYISFK